MYRSWLDVCTESDTFLFVFLVLTISRTARISFTKTENHVEVIKTSKQPDRDAKVRKPWENLLFFIKNQGGVKASAGSEMSLVSGKYHEDKVFAVMEMASICMKIRHVFADTFLPGNSVEHFLQ